MRNFDKLSLEPFLPFIKLLLSALYQLPLTDVPTYRGVKLALFEVSRASVCTIVVVASNLFSLCVFH